MNYDLPQMPVRTSKPRKDGLTMVMDKGLSNQEVINFLSISGPYVDIVKLGFGTSMVTPNLKEKIKNICRCKYTGLFRGHLIRSLFNKK